MRYSRLFPAIAATAILLSTIFWAVPADAGGQRHGHGRPGVGGGGRPVVVASGRPVVVAPRVVSVVPYRPYYYPYRPGLTFGFYAGYPYPYYYPYYSGYYGYGYPLPPP